MTGREFLERYGVTLLIVGLLALVIAILPGNAVENTAGSLTDSGSTVDDGVGGDDVAGPDIGGGSGTGGGVTTGGGGSTGSGGVPGVGGGSGTSGGASGAPVAGSAGKAIFGKGLCRSDGRESGIGPTMPPCSVLQGGNGGATSRGVTKDKITIVRYVGQQDPGTAAILEQAKLRDPENVKQVGYEGLRVYMNQHYNTYGREVVFRTLNASGKGDNDEAMKADAVKIANDIKAFGVVDGSPDAPIPPVLARELAQRGVTCVCTTSLSSRFYTQQPPYIIGSGLPTSDEYAVQAAEFIGKRLKGKKAQWAGDDINPAQRYRTMTRKFGLIYIEGSNGRVDPEGVRAKDLMVKALAKYGLKFAATAGYIYEGGRNAQDVTNVVAKMKNAKVTTVLTLTDPLYPIFITQEATRQGWFPEWFVTGSGLSDTTAAGRLYDGVQWRHAFGISPLWVTWKTAAKSGGHRAFHHGAPSQDIEAGGVLIDIYAAFVGTMFTGIHMAGPNLTPDNFARGMFSYPKTGGKPALPLVYWTREFPTAGKDFTEVWFDADRRGPDERGEMGTGMMMKVSGGKRYRPGLWPSTNPKAFVEDGHEIAVSDDPKLSGDLPHEQDGHTHTGTCMSCPGYKTTGGDGKP
jgi:hypothetical protein